MTGSLINYFTTFESTNNLPMQIVLGHGENADLVANFTDNGIPVSLSGYTARALFQPKSQWGTDNWYECPCVISGDTAIAHWGDAYDNGDNAVRLFMHLSKDGKVAYPAIYNIGLFATPGYTPGSIEPVQKTLDFSEYELVNAPWALADELSAYATVASLENETRVNVQEFVAWNPFPDEYLGQTIVIKTHDNDASIPEGYAEPYQEGAGSIGERKLIGSQTTLTWTANVDCALNLTATREVVSTGYYIGTQADKLMQPYGEGLTEDDIALSTVYSSNPKFSEWTTVNYQFTVLWNGTRWLFDFDGTLVGDNTGEWTDPNATHLYFNYDGISLEANRERLDKWYVLGSQNDKPLQPMGDYATIDDVESLPTVKTIVPDTLGTTIYVSAKTNHVYGVRPYGSNIHISATFSLPTSQLFECTFDVDTRDAENEIDLMLDTTTFRFLAESGGLVDTIAMNPGGLYRIHLTETTFAMESQPVIYVTRELLWEEV